MRLLAKQLILLEGLSVCGSGVRYGGSAVCIVESQHAPVEGPSHINVSARLHLRMSECTASLACVCQIFLFETPPVSKWPVPNLLMRLARGEVRGQHNQPGKRARKPTGAGDISLCVSHARRRFSVSENGMHFPPLTKNEEPSRNSDGAARSGQKQPGEARSSHQQPETASSSRKPRESARSSQRLPEADTNI